MSCIYAQVELCLMLVGHCQVGGIHWRLYKVRKVRFQALCLRQRRLVTTTLRTVHLRNLNLVSWYNHYWPLTFLQDKFPYDISALSFLTHVIGLCHLKLNSDSLHECGYTHAGLLCRTCGACSQRQTPSSRQRGDPISKYINNLGANIN
jgi:hypothetical protein